MRKYTFLYLLFALLTQCALGKDLRGELEEQMQIQMQFQGKSFVLSLENNAIAKDFYALLPLALSFSDYVGKEKIARLEKSLNAQESGEYNPQSGDFFYFAPWGNVGIFYAKQPPYKGLIKLGAPKAEKESFIAHLKAQRQDFILTIEKYPREE
ncbi:cyclophilin-like fold protein [Helicobacter rodentium]|uniref:cyclophilin-like fold protein n=1 Tax=Helicobacter rodentium TaxID=59617 RepID=UPI0023537CD4|nr:cyclophilin-like fold protein [Helicobacter rodentium]